MVQRRGYAEWVKKNETFQLVGMDQLNRLIANVFNTSLMTLVLPMVDNVLAGEAPNGFLHFLMLAACRRWVD